MDECSKGSYKNEESYVNTERSERCKSSIERSSSHSLPVGLVFDSFAIDEHRSVTTHTRETILITKETVKTTSTSIITMTTTTLFIISAHVLTIFALVYELS